MQKNGPNLGGIASVLMLIGGVELLIAFFAGAAADLSMAAEIGLMAGTFVFSSILWAAAAIVQELRKIEFNTRQQAPSVAASAQLAAPESLGESVALPT